MWVAVVVVGILGTNATSAPSPSSALALLPSAQLYSLYWDEVSRAPAWMVTSTAASTARLLHGALRTSHAVPACVVAPRKRAIDTRRFRLCTGGREECVEGAAAGSGGSDNEGAWSEDAATEDDATAQAMARASCAARMRRGGRPRARCARAPLLLGRRNATLDTALLTGGAAAMSSLWRRLGAAGDDAKGPLVNTAVQYYTGGDACDAAGMRGGRHIARLLHYCDGGATAATLAIRAAADAGAAPGGTARQHAWSRGCCQCQHSFLVASPALCAAGGDAARAMRARQRFMRAADAALESAFADAAERHSIERSVEHSIEWRSELTYGEITAQGALNVLDRLPAAHALNGSSSLFDLGSGEGRLTLLAAMAFGLRQAAGIEIVPARHNVAMAARRRLLGLLAAAAGREHDAEGVDGGGTARALLASVERAQLRPGDALEPGAFVEATQSAEFILATFLGHALTASARAARPSPRAASERSPASRVSRYLQIDQGSGGVRCRLAPKSCLGNICSAASSPRICSSARCSMRAWPPRSRTRRRCTAWSR